MEQIENRPKTTPKDFFLNLGAMVALYGSVISLINLLFEIINRLFPDNLNYFSYGYSSALRWAIAWLIVVFPVYVFISWYLSTDYRQLPARKNLPIRRWLVYLTLFLSSVSVVVDLITLINAFLSGELTARFAMKILAVLVVVGATFGYYLFDLKFEAGSSKRIKQFTVTVCVFILLSIIGAFVVVGSPFTERFRRFDDQRVSDLQSIQWQVLSFWQQKGRFPKDLAELTDPISGYKAPVDPENAVSYEYAPGEGASFKLCAVFQLSNKNQSAVMRQSGYPVMIQNGNESWSHNAGRVCFDRTVDPERYPIMKGKTQTL
jgi:hypothetical protein